MSDTVTLTYTVTVGQVFGATLKNVVTPGPTPCPDPVDDAPNIIDCDETTHFTPHFVLDKSVDFDDVDGDGKAEPGQTLTYKLTMTNDTTNATVTNAVVDDDVSDVLDNGSIVETPAELAAKGLVRTGSTLTWTVASLAPGATIEVTYQVLIAADQWGETLRNVATPGPRGACVKDRRVRDHHGDASGARGRRGAGRGAGRRRPAVEAKVLPSTGAPNYLEQLVLFAGLMLALGVTMTTLATMRGRRRPER